MEKKYFFFDIDGVEEIPVHEIPVTLIVFGADGIVFVQIICPDGREIDLPGLIPADQFPVQPDRGRTRGQPQQAFRFFLHQVRNDRGPLTGHFFIGIADNKLHVVPPKI